MFTITHNKGKTKRKTVAVSELFRIVFKKIISFFKKKELFKLPISVTRKKTQLIKVLTMRA